MTASKQEMIKGYVRDIQALVCHGLRAIDAQLKETTEGAPDEGHASAARVIRELERVLKRQFEALGERLTALGGSANGPKPLREALTRAVRIAAGAVKAVSPEDATRSLRDNYAFVGQCGIAYLMLFTTAEALGDNLTAGLAERGYSECARLSMEIDRLIPKLVLQELREGGHPVVDVTERALDMVRVAWDREAELGPMVSAS